jgi:hypothetical protein
LAYKTVYKAKHGWIAAVKVIADAIGRDERTVPSDCRGHERGEIDLPPIILDA